MAIRLEENKLYWLWPENHVYDGNGFLWCDAGMHGNGTPEENLRALDRNGVAKTKSITREEDTYIVETTHGTNRYVLTDKPRADWKPE